MNNKYAILFETTSIVSPSEITVLEEQDLGQGKSKAIFRSRFQTLNEQNSNRRIYDTLIGNMIYEQLSPKARNRSLLAEVDHPMFGTTDPNLLKKRATITEIQNAGALIRDLQVRNNEICGIMETLSGLTK